MKHVTKKNGAQASYLHPVRTFPKPPVHGNL